MSLKSYIRSFALMTAYFSFLGGVALLAISGMNGTGFKYAKDHYPFFATLNYDKAAMITPGMYALIGGLLIIIVLMLTETESNDNNVISSKLNTPFFYILIIIVTISFALCITLFVHIGSISLAYKSKHPYTNKPVYAQADKWDEVMKQISEQPCDCQDPVKEKDTVNSGKDYIMSFAAKVGGDLANGYCSLFCGGYYKFVAAAFQNPAFTVYSPVVMRPLYIKALTTNEEIQDGLIGKMADVLYGGYGPFVILSLINAVNMLLSSLLSYVLIVLLKLNNSKAKIEMQIPADKEEV